MMTRKQSSWLTPVALSVLFLGWAGACSNTTTVVPEDPPPDTVATDPEPEPEPPPEPETVYYQVYWQDIHVLTMYVGGGSLRGEEPDNTRDVFSGRSSYISGISHYYEQESDMRELIDSVDNIDALLELFLAAEYYEVREVELEEGY